jgi:sugar phosphate permease
VQAWTIAIAVILVLQTTSAYLSRLIPIASPAFMAEFGWHESWIGYLSAANIVGALFVLFVLVGLIRRLGSVLALQLSLLIGAVSLLLFQVPSLAVALLASALIGLSNGTANPAGSEVLQRYTPPAHRNFIFSIKQAGVPLGGGVAGLSVPALIEAFGWRTALLIAAAGALAATAVMLPFRARIDGPRGLAPDRIGGFRLAQLAVPRRSLTSGAGLLRICIVGAVFSIAQSCWFTFAVTYLVVGLGLSLGVAGLVSR